MAADKYIPRTETTNRFQDWIRLSDSRHGSLDFYPDVSTGTQSIQSASLERIMKILFKSITLIAFLLTTGSTLAWEPDNKDKMELSVAKAILEAKEKDATLAEWFESASGYAVIPRVGKAGFGIGGARGKGLVISGDATIGNVTLTQVTVGLQLGAQVYSEYIFFKDQTALDDFKRGNFELGAQVSAVAVNAGASADANYNKGVAVFTIAEGGLMYEASVGGQKLNFKATR
jgi:lipid-binding SYLF domain-containing protein